MWLCRVISLYSVTPTGYGEAYLDISNLEIFPRFWKSLEIFPQTWKYFHKLGNISKVCGNISKKSRKNQVCGNISRQFFFWQASNLVISVKKKLPGNIFFDRPISVKFFFLTGNFFLTGLTKIVIFWRSCSRVTTHRTPLIVCVGQWRSTREKSLRIHWVIQLFGGCTPPPEAEKFVLLALTLLFYK